MGSQTLHVVARVDAGGEEQEDERKRRRRRTERASKRLGSNRTPRAPNDSPPTDHKRTRTTHFFACCTFSESCLPRQLHLTSNPFQAASGPILARHVLEGAPQRPRDGAAPSRQFVRGVVILPWLLFVAVVAMVVPFFVVGVRLGVVEVGVRMGVKRSVRMGVQKGRREKVRALF